METIIATIQPVHLCNIRSGKKLFEIRKTLPAPLKIGHPVRCLCCESDFCSYGEQKEGADND